MKGGHWMEAYHMIMRSFEIYQRLLTPRLIHAIGYL